MPEPSFHLPDCSFCTAPSIPAVPQTKANMSSAAVIGTSLPKISKIAPPSTPIHMSNFQAIPYNKSPTVTRIVENTNNRHKSAPAHMSKTLVTSADYGSHHYTYKDNPNYSVYPPFITESQTASKIPPRVNPLQPPPPEKYSNTLETVGSHWHNEKRRNVMQQREWYRYHGTWSKAFYGSAAEREAYRKKTRETLKQQMTDFWTTKRRNWQINSKESQVSINYDNECMLEDATDHKRKTVYLMQYRDDNKTLMEQTWDRRNMQRKRDNDHENEILKYTPINWSHTLK